MSDTTPANEVILRVENLGKCFKIYPGQRGRIKEWLSLGRRKYHNDFWSLQHVSFELRKGEFMGVIGPNGAGKSTLLKIITGVLEPTTGSYSISGKVLSLLELSGGMDNDLTGRENVIRSAQLLGFPDTFLKERMDEIAAFAELGQFFDAPLNIYSSGMRIRLAFSLFAFLECDILILDEVLAVGDIFFQQKCYARLEELIRKNTAILMVTHSTGIVRYYCKDVMVLDKGEVLFEGPPEEAVQKYLQLQQSSLPKLQPSDTFMDGQIVQRDLIPGQEAAELTGWPETEAKSEALPENFKSRYAKLTQLFICNERGEPCQLFRQGERAVFYVEYQLKENVGVPVAGIQLKTVHNLLVHSKNSIQHRLKLPLKVESGTRLRFKQIIQLDLAPGSYIFNLNLSALHPEQFLLIESTPAREVEAQMTRLLSVKQAGAIEVMPRGNGSAGQELHQGMCNLPGELSFQVLDPVRQPRRNAEGAPQVVS